MGLKNWDISRYTTYAHTVTISEGSLSTQSIDADGPLTLRGTKQTDLGVYKVYCAPSGTKAIVTTHTAEANFVKQYIFTEEL